MNLKNIVIVLTHPEESRNIGAVCRAMANNDLSDLRIVGKREDYDDERVRILAIHAAGLWEKARFFDSVTAATADCVFSAGTTRRRGKKRKGKLLLPEEFAEQAAMVTGQGDKPAANAVGGEASATSAACGGKVAAVFGNERTGLTDEELLECTMGVTIPSSEGFASLNLSHAVQIIAYHLFRAKRQFSPGSVPITLQRLDSTVTCIADNLQKIGFFSITGRPDMEHFWRNILSRAALSEGEAAYLEKVFDKAAGLACKHEAADRPV